MIEVFFNHEVTLEHYGPFTFGGSFLVFTVTSSSDSEDSVDSEELLKRIEQDRSKTI